MIRLDQEGNPFIPHQVAVLPVRLFNKESGTYPLRMIDNGSAFHAGNLKQIVDEPLKVQVLVIGNAEVFRPLLFTGSNHIIPQQLQIIIEHGQGRLKVMGNVADYFLKCCLGGFQLLVGVAFREKPKSFSHKLQKSTTFCKLAKNKRAFERYFISYQTPFYLFIIMAHPVCIPVYLKYHNSMPYKFGQDDSG